MTGRQVRQQRRAKQQQRDVITYPLSVLDEEGEIHSCSYHCERPECIRAQRDELVQRLVEDDQAN